MLVLDIAYNMHGMLGMHSNGHARHCKFENMAMQLLANARRKHGPHVSQIAKSKYGHSQNTKPMPSGQSEMLVEVDTSVTSRAGPSSKL